jgi:DNA adenine methylase
MKTPISYYGGKLNLVAEILPMIPKHIQYVEPFIGGGAIFWAKKKSEHEVINDFDGRLINFWETVQNDFDNLKHMVDHTLHSEFYHKKASKILKQFKYGEDCVTQAWAYYVQSQMSFSHKLFGGFAFANSRGLPTASLNKREDFKHKLSHRLKEVEIFNRDAIELIKIKDSVDTFFYFDPPYAESDCAQYDKLKGVYYILLELLPDLKGKWLMSSYPSEQLNALRKQNNWSSKDIVTNLAVSGKAQQKAKRYKTECLTWNYDNSKGQQLINFDL